MTTLLALIVAAEWLLAAIVLVRVQGSWSGWALAIAGALGTGLVTTEAAIGAAVLAVVATGAILTLPAGRLAPRCAAMSGVVAVMAIAGAWWEASAWLALAAGPSVALAWAWQQQRLLGPMKRRRTQLVVLAAVLSVEVAAIGWTVDRLIGWAEDGTAVLLAGGLLLPPLVVLAASRHLDGRVDRLLDVTIIAGGVLLALAAVVLVVLAALGGRPEAAERDAVVVSLLAAAAMAAVLPGVMARLEIHANRLVYGAVDSPDDVARAFGARLTRSIPLEEMLLQLAEALRHALRAEVGEVWTASSGTLTLAASVPHVAAEPMPLDARTLEVVVRAGVSGGAWTQLWLPRLADRHGTGSLRVAPMAHAGELLGLLVTRRAAEADSYDERDHQVLSDLARRVGTALHNVVLDTALARSVDELRRTNEELRASRSRLVASGDAERRRIERNLHDGAQQHLVALAVQVRLVRDALVEGDHADALTLLDEARVNLIDTVTELRALAHGIYPPLLASSGLHEALAAAAARAGMPVTVVACPEQRFDEDLEAAVYFCCLEAMQNAVKHAGAGAVATIELAERDGALTFTVADDGVGFDTQRATRGQGITNMADRVGAIGGELEISSRDGGGAIVRGRLPLALRPTAAADRPAPAQARGAGE